MDHNLRSFLIGLGISSQELDLALYELDEYGSIPGTTIEKYIRRSLASVDNRKDFLKGIIIGTAVQEMYERDGVIG
jgi:hypothetical protein